MVYAQAALGLVRRHRPSVLPSAPVAATGVPVDRGRVAAGGRVWGFRRSGGLPATYPHVLAFPLAMRLMAAPSFPIPLLGLVHVANRISVWRPVTADSVLDFSVHAENLRPHERGRQLDVVGQRGERDLRQQPAELAQLVRVAGGEHDGHRRP